MFEIIFYKDKNGKEPVLEYMQALAGRKDKDSRVKFNKIQEYMQALANYGTSAGMPYMRHLEGGIWELRPIRDRILFAAWDGQRFVLLHHFVKKTQKTPQREIEQAKRNLEKTKERGVDDE